MHSGFVALRSTCRWICARQTGHVSTPEALADSPRVEIWRDALAAVAPFLFGSFTLADAMFAPVTTRLPPLWRRAHATCAPTSTDRRAPRDGCVAQGCAADRRGNDIAAAGLPRDAALAGAPLALTTGSGRFANLHRRSATPA